MKRVRFGFRSPLSLLGRTILPNALVVVTRMAPRDAERLRDWVSQGKALVDLIGNSDLRAWADRLFIEVE